MMNPSWLVAYDFSTEAAAVVEKTLEELESRKGQLYLLHVYHVPPPPTSFGSVGSETTYTSAQEFAQALGENAETHLKDVAKDLTKRFPNVTFHAVVREGIAIDEIIEAAKELKVDRVVVGTHGRRGVERFFMGSVAERVVRLSPVSVLVVKTAHQ